MWRIHTYHNKERLLRIAYIPFVLQIGYNHARFMQRRPFMRVMTFALRIPVMRILMFIESTVRIPVVKSMPTGFRRISVPSGYFIFYIMSRTRRIVRSRKIGMQFTKVSAIISRLTEYIAYTLNVFTQRTDRAVGVTIQRHTALIRIHSRQQRTTMGATQRTIAHCRTQH